MNKIKTLLAISNNHTSEHLRDLLSLEKQIKILGEAKTGLEALSLLENIDYELIFIDVDLKGEIGGLELAQIIFQRRLSSKIAFLAKHPDLALNAFEIGAIDYLLFPFNQERLQRTIERVVEYNQFKPIEQTASSEEKNIQLNLREEEETSILEALKKAWDYTSRQNKEISKLAINRDGKVILIPYNQIVYIEAFEDYTYVHTINEKYLTSYRLKQLEEKLSAFNFFRIHRKYLVNLELVTEIASLPGSNFMLRTMGKRKIELPISRRRIGELKSILGL